MRNSAGIKKNIRMAFMALAMALLLAPLPCGGAALADNPWQGVVRPGFMAGDGANETDFFLDVFLPVAGSEKALIFVNPNLRMDDQSSNEQNIGFGGRFLLNDNLILGANVFFDSMRSSNNNNYRQWGAGFEALGRWFDIRGNYYKPFGDSKHRVSAKDAFRFGQASLLRYEAYEEALGGFDAEAGVLVPFISDYVETRVYAGAYWYDSTLVDDSDISGEKYRLEIRPSRFIDISMEVWQDDTRGTDTFIGGYVELPFDVENLFASGNPFKVAHGTRTLGDRMTEKVVRDRHIRSREERSRRPFEIADMIYVNADNTGPGTGTYSDPYADIMDVEADSRYADGVWVYVFGSDDSADVYDANITLLPGMVLWGQAYALNNLGGDGPMPVLNGGGAGNVITLGTNGGGFEVMGLTVENGDYGIYGSNITSAVIHDNIIRNNAMGGVRMDNSFAGSDISGLNLYFAFMNNEVTGNFGDGIYIANSMTDTKSVTNSSIATLFEGNLVSDNSGDGVELKNMVMALGSASGVVEEDFSAVVTDTHITNTFTSNTLGGNNGNGVNIGANILYAYMDVEAGSTVDGSVLSSVSSSSIANAFTGNSVSGNAMDGLHMFNNLAMADVNIGASAHITDNVTGSVFNTSIDNAFTGNTIDGNLDDGLDMGYSGLYSFVSAGDMAAVGGDMLSTVGFSGITNAFDGNSMGFNQGYGAKFYFNWAQSELLAAGSSVAGGMTAGVSDVGIEDVFTSNTAGGNASGGFYQHMGNYLFSSVVVYGGSTGGVASGVRRSSILNVFEGNDISGNSGAGLYLGGVLGANWAGAMVDVYGAAVGGNAAARVSGTDISNAFTGNAIDDNGSGGLTMDGNSLWSSASTPASTVSGGTSSEVAGSNVSNALTGNSVSGNAGDGVYITNAITAASDGTGDITACIITESFTGNTVTDNGGNGLATSSTTFAATSDGSAVRLMMQGNVVTYNGLDGVDAAYAGNGSFTGDMGGGTLGSTGGNSFHDNGGFDVDNNTATGIMADGNWWGADADPIEAGQTDGTVNASQWLGSAP